MWTVAYWKAVGERMIRGAAVSVAASYFAGDVALNAWSMDWKEAAGIAVGGALGSLVLALVMTPVGAKGSPSVTVDPSIVDGNPRTP